MNKEIQAILNGIQPETKKRDCIELFNILTEITKEPSRIWGKQMIGFGEYSYKRSDGKEGEWFMTGFAPRSQNISIYLLAGFEGELKPYLESLGKYKLGKGCLYLKQLSDVDKIILRKMMVESYEILKERYKEQ